jgi:hypothetical protein
MVVNSHAARDRQLRRTTDRLSTPTPGVEQPASLPSRLPEEPNAYLGPGMALHSEAAAQIDQQPIAIHPQHAPFDALCAPHR